MAGTTGEECMPPQDDSDRESGTDRSTVSVTDLEDRLDPLESAAPSDLGRSNGTVPGFNVSTAALVAGGVFSVRAIRALANRRLRAIPYGAVGVALLVRGLSDVAGDPEALSLERESADRLEGDHAGGCDTGDADERTEGVDDEVASDPRTTEDGVDVDRSAESSADEATGPESTEAVDDSVDDPPSANEASEATGPKPQQAEPTQTDATEPEDTPPGDPSPASPEPSDEDASGPGESTDDEDSGAESLGNTADDDGEPTDS